MWGRLGRFHCLLLVVLVTLVTGNVEELRCPSRIERFSSKISPGHYYQCDDDIPPVLMECPEGQLYHSNKQVCTSRGGEQKNKVIDEKAMGRSFQLGSLYNVKASQFYEDSSLWSKNTIDANKFSYDRKEVNTDFRSDRTVRDRTSHFDISAKLSMDFMGGLVSVSGAMSYLDDEVSSEKEVNVEMLYHTTKYTETLPKYTPIDYRQECDHVNDPYTHVVTSVTYGLDCNFVFKYMLAEHETESSITGQLSITINNIPSFSISGSGEVNLTESEQNMMEKTDLKMYGDFSLGPNDNIPANYYQAVDFYKNLPVLASEQASILEVHMTPIEDICKKEDYILNELSESMMAEVIDMLDKLNQLEIKAEGLMITNEAVKFPVLKKNLNIYKRALKEYTDDVMNQLQDILPKIRGGGGEEALVSLLQDYTNSPFEFDVSDQFLIDRNREISAISFLLASFPDDATNIAVADYEQATDVEFLLHYEYLTMLDFKILTPTSLTESFLNGHPQNESNFWYNSIAVNGQVGSLLRKFSDFALENADELTGKYGYIIKLEVLDDEEDPTTMTAYYKGVSFTDNFVVPSAPLAQSIHDISYDSFRFNIPKLNEFTTGVQVIVTNAYEEDDQFMKHDDFEGENIEISITEDVKAATAYTIVAQYTTRMGLGPVSPSSRRFITAPSSTPSNLAVSDITPNSMKVTWEEPETIILKDLVYSVELKGENGYMQKKSSSSENEAIFEDLVDSTRYNIEARAYVKASDLGFSNETIQGLMLISTSQPAVITQYSNPLAPTMIPSRPGEVTTSSAIVRWEPPSKLPAYTDLEYNLVYASVDDNGNLGEEVSVSVKDVEFFEVTGLAVASYFSFRVQVVTDLGKSKFSTNLLVKTHDEESEIGQFEKEIKESLENIVNESKKRSSFCASAASTNTVGTLTYDKLILDQNNIVGAAMDHSTGTFTAGCAGSYEVMVSAEVTSEGGQEHRLWVAVNGENMAESLVHTKYRISMYGTGSDNASRDLVLNLKAGDTVAITHQTAGAGGLVNLIFCVSSIKCQTV